MISLSSLFPLHYLLPFIFFRKYPYPSTSLLFFPYPLSSSCHFQHSLSLNSLLYFPITITSPGHRFLNPHFHPHLPLLLSRSLLHSSRILLLLILRTTSLNPPHPSLPLLRLTLQPSPAVPDSPLPLPLAWPVRLFTATLESHESTRGSAWTKQIDVLLWVLEIYATCLKGR